MFDLKQMAIMLIQRNPNIAQNPLASQMLAAIQNGDDQAGQQIAANICQTYGVTPEQATQQAKQFFHL